MLVRGNQWKQLLQQQLLDRTWEKRHDWMITAGKNDLCYDLHRITKQPN